MSAQDPGGGDGDLLPEWVTSLKVLTGASALGVGLTEDPLGFVQAAIVSIVGGYLAELVGTLINLTELLTSTIITGLSTAFAPILSPFAVIGDSLLSLLDLYESVLVTLSTAAGPLSPFVFVLGMLSTVVIGFATARVAISVYLFIRSAIV